MYAPCSAAPGIPHGLASLRMTGEVIVMTVPTGDGGEFVGMGVEQGMVCGINYCKHLSGGNSDDEDRHTYQSGLAGPSR